MLWWQQTHRSWHLLEFILSLGRHRPLFLLKNYNPHNILFNYRQNQIQENPKFLVYYFYDYIILNKLRKPALMHAASEKTITSDPSFKGKHTNTTKNNKNKQRKKVLLPIHQTTRKPDLTPSPFSAKHEQSKYMALDR